MPETTSHRIQMTLLLHALNLLVEPLERVYVGGNHFVYYNVDDPKDNVAPDAYVVFDIPRGEREAFRTFEEGKFPDLIVELISSRTRKDDLGKKKEVYAEQGAQEYYIYDPRPWRHRTRPFFQAYTLVDGVYVPRVPSAQDGVFSPLLGTELRVIGRWLRVMDPRTGQPIPTPEEEAVARQAAEARAAQGEQARQAAEARAAHSEAALQEALAELARLRGGQQGDGDR